MTIGAAHAGKARFVSALHLGEQQSNPLTSVWAQLADRQQHSLSIYQGEAHYRHTQNAVGAQSTFVVSVNEAATGALIGVAPILRKPITLPFKVGSRTLFTIKFCGVTVLGSEPLIPNSAEALNSLFDILATSNRTTDAIEMEMVVCGGFLWRHLMTETALRNKYLVYKADGVRNCHYIKIPKTMTEYYCGMTKKKRYNYRRQERILREHAGENLRLTRVDKTSDCDELFDAIEQLQIAQGDRDLKSIKDHYLSASKYSLMLCYILKSDSIIVGVVLGFKEGTRFSVHKIHYEKSLSKYSPGTTLWQLVLAEVIRSAACEVIDMGYGNPRYTYHGVNHIEPRARIVLVRKTPANRICVILHWGFRGSRTWLRSALQSMKKSRFFTWTAFGKTPDLLQPERAKRPTLDPSIDPAKWTLGLMAPRLASGLGAPSKPSAHFG